MMTNDPVTLTCAQLESLARLADLLADHLREFEALSDGIAIGPEPSDDAREIAEVLRQ